jgi:hypothetical protein
MTTRRTRSLDLICYKDVRCTMRIDLFTAGIKWRSLDRKPITPIRKYFMTVNLIGWPRSALKYDYIG